MCHIFEEERFSAVLMIRVSPIRGRESGTIKRAMIILILLSSRQRRILLISADLYREIEFEFTLHSVQHWVGRHI